MTFNSVKSPLLPPCAGSPGSVHSVPCPPADRRWILLATILGSALAFMDGSVVNIALPTLQASFSATAGEVQWVVQSYALFASALLLLGGAIGDSYGRRRAFASGVVIFAVSSAACALAPSLTLLVLARSAQGLGAALLVPQSLSILSNSFPEQELGKAIGTWSAWTTVFSSIGPVAGGWLIQVGSWRLIFFLNLPFTLIILLLLRKIPESRAESTGGPDKGQPRKLDALGTTLVTLGFAAIIYALSFAPQLGWANPRISAGLIAGLVLLVLFLASQTTRPNAMMPLQLFRITRFWVPNLLTFLLYGALGGTLYVIPFYLIGIRHYAPTQAGAVFLPMIAVMFALSSRVGAWIPLLGEKSLLFAGSLVASAGFAAFAVLDSHPGYVASMLPGILLLGVGLTLVVTPLTAVVLSSVPQDMTGVASAVNNAISRLAALLAVSLLTLLLSYGFDKGLQAQLSRSTLSPAARDQFFAQRAKLQATPIPPSLSPQQQREAAAIRDRSFLDGFQIVMYTCAAAAGFGALTVLIFMGKSHAEKS